MQWVPRLLSWTPILSATRASAARPEPSTSSYGLLFGSVERILYDTRAFRISSLGSLHNAWVDLLGRFNISLVHVHRLANISLYERVFFLDLAYVFFFPLHALHRYLGQSSLQHRCCRSRSHPKLPLPSPFLLPYLLRLRRTSSALRL